MLVELTSFWERVGLFNWNLLKKLTLVLTVQQV